MVLVGVRKVPSLAKGHATTRRQRRSSGDEVAGRSITASYVAFGICPSIPFYVYAILFTMDSTSRSSPCPSGISQTRSSLVAAALISAIIPALD